MEADVCRICLERTATISLFDEYENEPHCAKLMRCVNVLITHDDGLPSMICSKCLGELFISYNFVQKCETSDKTLKCFNILNSSKIELNIKEEYKFEIDHDHYDDKFSLVTDLKSSLHSLPLTETISDTSDKITIISPESILDSPSNPISPDIIHNTPNDNSTSKTAVIIKKTKEKSKKKKVKSSKEGTLQCVYCGLLVISHSALKIHMRIHTGETPFKCLDCDRGFISKGALKRHVETFHSIREKKFTCETCGNSFFRKNDIITHMRTHTDERPYNCPFCPKKFRQVASLIRHKRIHTGEKPYACPICDKKFIDKSLMMKHQSVHSDEKKYSCHLCGKSVKSKAALNTHLGLHTNKKTNVCSYCGMAFSMKGNLKMHIQRVHSEKSGQCNVCLKTFSDLEEHMHKHTGLKPYVCELCSTAFSSKRSLTHHIVFKHENASKFKCSIGDCTKTFPTATMLEFHLLKQHTNHTPYVCQHCSRGFFRTSDLSRHLRVNHLEMQLKVPLKINVPINVPIDQQ